MNEPAVMANAVIYLRVSTKEQAHKGGEAEGYSIPAQRAACERKAASLNAQIVADGEFVDAGESAKTSARPKLQAMLKRLAKGDIRYVIVHKVDRLARNRFDDVTINASIIESGAQLVSVSENIDETPSGSLMHGIMSSIAEFYSKNLATEVTKGMIQKLQAGGTVSMVPLGYRNVTKTAGGRVIKTVEVDTERGLLMHWAFEAYATGKYSLNTLVNALESKGLTFPATEKKPERPVRFNQLYKLLTNKYYTGIVTWRGVEYQGNHPRLVSEELFNAAQEVLRRHAVSGERSYRATHYLKGSLICSRCKSRVTFGISSNGKGIQYKYFFCLGRHEKRTDCDLPFMQSHLIEKAINKEYASEPIGAEEITTLRTQLLHDLSVYEKTRTKKQTLLETRIKKLESERYRWAEKAMEGTVPDDIAKEKQTGLAKQLKQANKELRQHTVSIQKAKQGIDKLCDLVEQCNKLYVGGKPSFRQDLNQALFDCFEIDAEEQGLTTPVVYFRRLPAFEALKTAQYERADNLSNAIENEEKRRERYGDYSVFSVIEGLRVPTLVTSRGIEPRLPG
jgi:site-specific DNA recombinase